QPGRPPRHYRVVVGRADDQVLVRPVRGSPTEIDLKEPGDYWWSAEAHEAHERSDEPEASPPLARRSAVERFTVAAHEPAGNSSDSSATAGSQAKAARLALTFMPSNYRYTVTGDATGTDIDATLFNSFAVGMRALPWRLGDGA